MEKGKLVMELMVETFPDKTVELDSEIGHVKMIPFGGTVKSDIFNGIIEPCGVDTQVTNQAGVRHMSARYMLTGKDADGNDCHIYLENNAWFTNGERPKPWISTPKFITDSKKLATYLHTNQFIGEGMRVEEGLRIRYYEVAR
ncbi:Protein of unknown function [Oribacterium sp. KHPX15]|uniref:DUF3237 family protein n=1 Tax=Oribacterium sp. KHPX15 TaxID=1855342 RepID=UPI0008965EE1|nr:DUF3237 family protein [Oribacterium sp. KHPX15]SDZ80606.1 Protein of unknown function [Oribacterium sp. KHPX15]